MICEIESVQQVGKESTSALAPWLVAPLRLVSWWSMEKFAAEKFCNICSGLTGLSEQYKSGGVRLVDANTAATLIAQLEGIIPQCREIGLNVTALQVEAVVGNLRRVAFAALQVSQALQCLGQALTAEMSTQLFLRVKQENAHLYDAPELCGPEVAKQFPSASRDVRSAGTCYALDLTTACVMHLMRVLELGLNALADELGVTFERRNWENVIDDIEKAIEAKYDKGQHPADQTNWRDKRDFYHGAAKDFKYFKNAWRNHAMHVHEHYDANEAGGIADHVQDFMKHLAKNGLREKLQISNQ